MICFFQKPHKIITYQQPKTAFGSLTPQPSIQTKATGDSYDGKECKSHRYTCLDPCNLRLWLIPLRIQLRRLLNVTTSSNDHLPCIYEIYCAWWLAVFRPLYLPLWSVPLKTATLKAIKCQRFYLRPPSSMVHSWRSVSNVVLIFASAKYFHYGTCPVLLA